MNTKQTINKNLKIYLIVMVFIQSLVLIYLMNKKQNLFCDEIFSYSLSNSKFGILFEKEGKSSLEWHNRWIDSKTLKDYISVSSKNIFDYKNVYYNQTLDCHPPLFYYIIHTICSFFPNTFSKWYGFSFNIVLFVFVQLLLFVISKKTFNSDNYALLTCFIYGFSSCAIDCFIFIRMYSFQSFFYLLYVYFIMKLLEKNNSIYYYSIILVTILGSLTQYHFYLFCFFIDLTLIIITERHKILHIVIANIFGFIISNLYFPYFYQHIVNSSNGLDALNIIDRISPCILSISYTLQEFLGLNTTFSIYISLIFVLSLFVFAIVYFVKHYFDKSSYNNMLIVYLTTFVYTAFIFSTINYKYFGIILSGRYFFPICPMIIIIIVSFLYKLKKEYLTYFVIILIVSSNYQTLDYYYPYIKENSDVLRLEKLIKNKNLIIYCNETGIYHSLFLSLLQTNKIFSKFYNNKKNIDLNEIPFTDKESTYLLIYPSNKFIDTKFTKIMEGKIEYWPYHFGLYDINSIRK